MKKKEIEIEKRELEQHDHVQVASGALSPRSSQQLFNQVVQQGIFTPQYSKNLFKQFTLSLSLHPPKAPNLNPSPSVPHLQDGAWTGTV